jgi:hypothetical protein
MGKIANLKGQKFGRLIAVRTLGLDKHHKMRWLCRCVCGGRTIAHVTTLRRGSSQSCGCLQKERASEANLRHGESWSRKDTPEYRAWVSMIRRCYNKNTLDYPNYGGRGIKVYRAWRKSYLKFLAHIGRRPSQWHSIDRIDNDGNYRPGNVQWATKKQQNNNTRTIRRPRKRNA